MAGLGIGLAIGCSPMGTGIDGGGNLGGAVVATVYQGANMGVGAAAGVSIQTSADGLSAIFKEKIKRRVIDQLTSQDNVEIQVEGQWDECVEWSVLGLPMGVRWETQQRTEEYEGDSSWNRNPTAYTNQINDAIDAAYDDMYDDDDEK